MERWLHKFEIKPGRWVVVPSAAERHFGEELLEDLKGLWQPPSHFFHLREGGHIAALKNHWHHLYFGCLDIEDFFGSINRSRLIRTLKLIVSYPEAVTAASRSLVRLRRNGEPYYCLPFGFTQSAYLASMCLHESKLGRTLDALAKSPETRLSVYMDDIIISSNNLKLLKEQINLILSASEKSRFPMNQDKLQMASKSVTVFNIIMRQGELRITPDRMREFRVAYRESRSAAQSEGIIEYVKTVNPTQVSSVIS